jgi:hypothetical protein
MKAWQAREVVQRNGRINVYEVGFSPLTRFEYQGAVYRLPAKISAPLITGTGAIPAGPLEAAWAWYAIPWLWSHDSSFHGIDHPGSYIHNGNEEKPTCVTAWESELRPQCREWRVPGLNGIEDLFPAEASLALL